MPPKKAKKKQGDAFGNALINSKQRKKQKVTGEGNHGPTKYDIPDSAIPIEDRLRSKTDDYTLGDFVTEAELNGKTFAAQRGEVRIVDRVEMKKEVYAQLHRTPEQDAAEARLKNRLRIPRRPKWDESTTPEQLHELETAEIIEWRRALSILEENKDIVLSPFEKNPEVWKELWRVLERSQVAIYIIDSRDPLAFFCDDFVRYINEIGIPLIVCLNKADLVPPQIRLEWGRYFDSLQMNLQFKYEFLSTIPKNKPKIRPSDEDSTKKEKDMDDSQNSEDIPENSEISENITENSEISENISENTTEQSLDEREKQRNELYEGIITPRELILRAKSLASAPGRDGRITIGFVGFPNVGKSSMLNSAVGRICVKSSMTPGKTKHLQTINMEEEGVTLCDCPGLVFPLFQQSRAAMICNGILSIDQMTDWLTPSMIVAETIPARAFNYLYGTTFKERYVDAHTLLQAIAIIRSLMTTRGNPDEARVAKSVLKDYVAGKLIHCELPPGVRLATKAQISENQSNENTEAKQDEITATEFAQPKGERKSQRKLNLNEKPPEEPNQPVALPTLPQSSTPKSSVQQVYPKRKGVLRVTSLE